MKNIVNKLKLAVAGAALCFSLGGCEPVKEELVPDYSAVKSSITQMPYAWESYMERGNRNAALNLTYPGSAFERYTYEGRVYDFEDTELSLPWFKPENGEALVHAKVWNGSDAEYERCRIYFKKIDGTETTNPQNWKLRLLIIDYN